MNTPLGTEVDLGTGHVVLDVYYSRSTRVLAAALVPAVAKGVQQPPPLFSAFSPMSIVATVSATAELFLYILC